MTDEKGESDDQADAPSIARDLQGLRQALVDGVVETSRVVEAMHGTIASVPPIFGRTHTLETRGLTGLTYRNVRGITNLVGGAVDIVLRQLTPYLGQRSDTRAREEVVAAINGLVGAHLEASGNPLALRMRLRQEGRTIDPTRWQASSRHVVVFAHGSCMSDIGFTRQGHNHGRALAEALEVDVVHVHYNSGLAIAANGQRLDALLESLVAGLDASCRLTLVGFSMGGLLFRSALHHATVRGATWPAPLQRLVTIGTPHHGAPLERGGHRVTRLLEVTPYSAPLARLATVRGAGIQDLRHGAITEADHAATATRGDRVERTPVPLPAGVACHAIAGTLSDPCPDDPLQARSDGLVPVASALGYHPDAALALAFPDPHRLVIPGCSHLGLLNHAAVAQHLVEILGVDENPANES